MHKLVKKWYITVKMHSIKLIQTCGLALSSNKADLEV